MAGGDPNLYAYVFNSPVNLTDPAGLAAARKIGKLAWVFATDSGGVAKTVEKISSKNAGEVVRQTQEAVDKIRKGGGSACVVCRNPEAMADALGKG